MLDQIILQEYEITEISYGVCVLRFAQTGYICFLKFRQKLRKDRKLLKNEIKNNRIINADVDDSLENVDNNDNEAKDTAVLVRH